MELTRSCCSWQVHHGLIWVWPESGPESFIESAATPIVTCPDLEDEDALNPGACFPLSARGSLKHLKQTSFATYVAHDG